MVNQEYPDLPFRPPRAWGQGREGNPVQFIVIHYTAGSERSTSAEDGAAFDARRTDEVSTHYFVDSDSVVQCVYTWDRANAAFRVGNRRGIQYEICGTLQTRQQWLDPASDATLWLAARQIARDCRKYNLPVVRLTPVQMRAGARGICGHVDVTHAYGLGDHTDPGPGFPWDILLSRIAAYLPGLPASEENDMRGILGTLQGRATIWYGQKGVVPLEAVADMEVADAYTAAGAVSKTFHSSANLVTALGMLPGDDTGEQSRAAVGKAG